MKFVLYTLLFILLFSSVNALIVTPQQQTVELFTSSSKNFYLNLTNNLNEKIYHVQLSSDNPDITYIMNNFDLEINESKEVKMVLSTSSSYMKTTEIKIIFFKDVDVELEPTAETVNIQSTQYNPSYIEVVEGSTITWMNLDTIIHSVTSTLFDYEIDPNVGNSYIFNNVGVYDYYDKFSTYSGQVVVIDKSSEDYAHNPNDDVSVFIDIISKKIDTELEFTFIDNNNFTIEANRQKDSVILVKNVGSKTAENVMLSGQWLTFGKNGFFLASGDETYVTFTIIPQILNGDETNKTHNINLTVEANNSLPVTKQLSVFVPFMENVSIDSTINYFFNQTFDENDLLALHNLVCIAYPEYTFCKPEVKEVIIYKSPPVSYNYTQEDINNINRRQLEMYAQLDRSQKEFNTLLNEIKESATTAKDAAVSTKTVVEELHSKEDKNKEDTNLALVSFIVFLILVIVAVVAFFGVKWFKKWNEKRSIYGT